MGGIVDDELCVWLEAIYKKDASVFIIFDTCYSGTATRRNRDGSAHPD